MRRTQTNIGKNVYVRPRAVGDAIYGIITGYPHAEDMKKPVSVKIIRDPRTGRPEGVELCFEADELIIDKPLRA